jgi:ABC-type transporter Mla MlaB component
MLQTHPTLNCAGMLVALSIRLPAEKPVGSCHAIIHTLQEIYLKIITTGTVAHLQGDLTHSGATHTIIKSLTVSLQQIVTAGLKTLHIDCGRIRSADTSGLQLLYVWMQCARFRGVEPELINLSECLQSTLLSLGLGDCFRSTFLAD